MCCIKRYLYKLWGDEAWIGVAVLKGDSLKLFTYVSVLLNDVSVLKVRVRRPSIIVYGKKRDYHL